LGNNVSENSSPVILTPELVYPAWPQRNEGPVELTRRAMGKVLLY